MDTLIEKEIIPEGLLDELLDNVYSIVLYNDDHNTFEHVINCLRKYCKHTLEQAEQCAMIVHFNGKIAVKNGAYKQLKPISESLLEEGLSVKIE